jgi:hypothetical protein
MIKQRESAKICVHQRLKKAWSFISNQCTDLSFHLKYDLF